MADFVEVMDIVGGTSDNFGDIYVSAFSKCLDNMKLRRSIKKAKKFKKAHIPKIMIDQTVQTETTVDEIELNLVPKCTSKCCCYINESGFMNDSITELDMSLHKTLNESQIRETTDMDIQELVKINQTCTDEILKEVAQKMIENNLVDQFLLILSSMQKKLEDNDKTVGDENVLSTLIKCTPKRDNKHKETVKLLPEPEGINDETDGDEDVLLTLQKCTPKHDNKQEETVELLCKPEEINNKIVGNEDVLSTLIKCTPKHISKQQETVELLCNNNNISMTVDTKYILYVSNLETYQKTQLTPLKSLLSMKSDSTETNEETTAETLKDMQPEFLFKATKFPESLPRYMTDVISEENVANPDMKDNSIFRDLLDLIYWKIIVKCRGSKRFYIIHECGKTVYIS